jgi:hypothetical protein
VAGFHTNLTGGPIKHRNLGVRRVRVLPRNFCGHFLQTRNHLLEVENPNPRVPRREDEVSDALLAKSVRVPGNESLGSGASAEYGRPR